MSRVRSYIIGARIPEVPYAISSWRKANPDQAIADGQVFTQPWPANEKQRAAGRRDKVTYYRYKADSARRTLHGIDHSRSARPNAPWQAESP